MTQARLDVIHSPQVQRAQRKTRQNQAIPTGFENGR
jgi:hypothetical protein